MPDFNTAPWEPGSFVTFVVLCASTLIVLAVPLVYGLRANLRDPLARAVLVGTGAPALALALTVLATLAFHAGWEPTPLAVHWMRRLTYGGVAVGELVLLVALIKVLRAAPKKGRQ